MGQTKISGANMNLKKRIKPYRNFAIYDHYMSRRLRIAMFFSSDPATFGGVQEHVYYLAKNLNQMGHNVSVFTSKRPRYALPFPGHREIGEFTEFRVGNNDLSFVNKKKSENYDKFFSRRKFDFFHIHDPFMPFLGWELLDRLELPIVTTYHATWERSSPINAVNAFLPLFKDGLSKNVIGSIFVSKRTFDCWHDVFLPGTKKIIIPNGIDREIFGFEKKSSKKIKFLFVARLVARKGLKYLLPAFKKVINDFADVELTVVGEGPEEKSVKEYVIKNNLQDNVKFAGYVKNSDKPNFYHRSHVFCAPYVNEGFGITILEAMATGTTIVAFKNNAFEEILKNYPAKKLIVGKDNHERLVSALKTAAKDGKLRNKVADWEKREIVNYDWKEIAKKTEKFYFSVLSQ